MLDVKKVRGGNGLDPIGAEVDEILASAEEAARVATKSFFDSFQTDPNPAALATWLETRVWREIAS